MKLLRRFTAATMLLASTAAMASAQMASAQSSGQNDSVDYAPRVKTVAGTLPLDTQYPLAVYAPTKLNKQGDEALPNGIPAELRVNLVSSPEDSTPAAAPLVSVDPSAMVFDALGQERTTTVRVTASANTTPGDYMYTIQAVGPTGLGWGISNHTLTVTVSRPGVPDTTPPAVTITAPTAGLKFTFCTGGTTVPVTISAADAESVITTVGGTVNGVAFPVTFAPANTVVAEGQFAATAVGAYELKAWATSAGGTGYSSPVVVTVNYAISWMPPISNGGTIRGALPIKFDARDCHGTFVADSTVRVEVWEGTVLQFSAVYGDGSDFVRINEDQGHYIANFKPAAGNHTYTVKVLFNGYLQASRNVVTQ
jgi:hypothetical protein